MIYKYILKILLPIILSVIAFYINQQWILELAKTCENIFINLLKLISLPVVFFSITSTISKLTNFMEIRILIKKTTFYTIITTIIAATIALITYILINPSSKNIILNTSIIKEHIDTQSYLSYLISILPHNFIKVFLDNNIIGCVILAFLMGGALLSLPDQSKRELLNKILDALFDTFLEITKFILKLMPIALWSFITVLLYNLNDGYNLSSILKYLSCIIIANFIQAFIILPLLLKLKGISTINTFRGIMPALIVAFFSKSSTATLPTTLRYTQDNLNISKKVSSFILPVCTTINMNACAAFILITVLFVSEINGYTFSISEMLLWVFLATGGAIGNAGIPMGCYFMAMSYLISMKIPLNTMGIILPIYTIIDMFETAINVWSDVCITQVVNKEYYITIKNQ
ncbi:proton/sodium-glutamate symport protein [Ehrlichia ruminantium]|uniref:dicarboxylate/amino acid:cation symporter n=1 Tax=Ehrlichia ruminantium TaxID=779 RepID=UPI0007C13D49|nr:dicarboxylate/amino acid:cation symporter [Ehrlichia ruminantium]QLK52377.1 dicarboxylate/amino acid:cation symporter [Ehrlichia ruminantium]QLK54207.1 dicarboxylate/amino acid:cation symporter [Ehrlichia ruminantium]QLK56959.1 dicarboxylate/amino acid:cation symporter [Ehrlichia ruminantium]GAT76289.1 proton/sodium-glutamate symport protein [Ehrlichia ruminantium]